MTSAEAAAITALAEHLGVPREAILDWLQQPHVVPPKVLLGWIVLWHRDRS